MVTTAEGVRIGTKGSLLIKPGGGWHCFESGKGGRAVGTLVAHLLGIAPQKAALWCRQWLEQHPGDGTLDPNGTAEAAAEAGERRAVWARQILAAALDPAGTPAEAYLLTRSLEPPYPDIARFLPDARLGECAVVGILTDPAGEALGLQLGYLDPRGGRSTIPPQRQILLLDKEKAGQGAFRVPGAAPAEDAATLVICEGLEDALSLAQSGAARQVFGIPGIGRFSNFDLPAGAAVVVFRDGDDPASPAAKQLGESIGRWVSAGVTVRVTATPEGEDANSILQTKGAEELRRLIAEAAPAELGFDADVVRLARLLPLDYERERTAAAARHGVRLAFVDAAVKAVRAEAAATAAAEADEDESLHPEPVPDLAEVLEAALTELRRYVVASEHDLAAAVVWAMHAHFVHHETVYLPVSPKLAIQSPDRGCGKSTMLEVLGALVPRPVTGSSITASVVFRLIEAKRPTLLLDEADRIVRSSNDELIAILNSSHRRSGAFVWRSEEVGGQHVPTRFSTWGPVRFAGIRELPPTLQDRSLIIRLARARPGEVLHHLRDGTSPALRLIKQKLARAAADMMHLPDPQLPRGLHNRAGDNWSPLFSVAAVAGGRWPGLVMAAALAGLSADQQEGTLVALLDGIKRAFGEQERLSTRAMLDFLIADDEHDWTTTNRGRVVNEAFLRERLRGVIAPAADGKPGSEQWRSGRIRERGYTRGRFLDAWQRYLPSKSPENARDSGDIRDTPPNPRKGNGKFVTDEEAAIRDGAPPAGNGNGSVPDTAAPQHTRKDPHPRQKKPIKSKAVTGGPGVTGDLGVLEEGMPPADGEIGPEELL